jgi:hypothetical protein
VTQRAQAAGQSHLRPVPVLRGAAGPVAFRHRAAQKRTLGLMRDDADDDASRSGVVR